MTNEKALAPREQKWVEFYGDEIPAVVVESGQIYIALRPIVDYLGLDWSAQYRRLARDPVLSEAQSSVAVTAMDGRTREQVCLPLDYLNGWLFGISADRVRPQLRDRVIRYQRDCYKVLHDAFQEGRLSQDPSLDDLFQSDTPAVQAYKMFQALTRLARSQVLLEEQMKEQEQRVDGIAVRLELVEATLGDRGRFISPEQAGSISQAVKSIAMALGKKSGRNEYGAVYGEFYRKFGIPSYRELPARRFDEAARFLAEWYQTITGEGLPF